MTIALMLSALLAMSSPAGVDAASAPVASADAGAEAEEGGEEEALTLEEIDELDKYEEEISTTTHDDFLLQFGNKGRLTILAPEPPTSPSEYEVALATVMKTPTDKLFWFAGYKGVKPQENVGTDIRLGKSEARIATVEVGEGLQEAVKYYTEFFRKKGVSAIRDQLNLNTVYFSFREEDGFMRTVTLVGINENRCVALAAVTDARKVFEGYLGLDEDDTDSVMSDSWGDWKEPEIIGRPIVIDQSGDGAKQSLRKVRIEGTSPQAAMDVYRRELSMNGWKFSVPKEIKAAGAWGQFEKGNHHCIVSISTSDEPGMLDSMAMCFDSND